jgi:hypothetical protein
MISTLKIFRTAGLANALMLMTMLLPPAICAAQQNAGELTVAAGSTYVVPQTTQLKVLTIGEGAILKAPEGYSLTLTVNGIETGQKLLTTYGVDTGFIPGVYRGDVVLTVAQTNAVKLQNLTFPLRQALYLDGTGIVASKSVLPAVAGKPTPFEIKDLQIRSTGEAFNGIYVAGGNYTLRNVKIDLDGNGRSDFAGYGAAIVGTGKDTRLVLDGVDIKTKGTVRTALIADGGSNVIVKNSSIRTMDGVLPSDYQMNVNTANMRGAFIGNVRATNLLGPSTHAAYINTSVFSEGWGDLSVDASTNTVMTAIDSKLEIGHDGGYGSYAIGDPTENFLGCELNVGLYAVVVRSGVITYGDSTVEAVAKLNADLKLGLTPEELKALPARHTTIDSREFGVMFAGGGTVEVNGGTVINTEKATFVDKGAAATIAVDGSKGARLNPKNGVILQVMDDDDPGPDMPSGVFTKPWIDPTTAPERKPSFDLTSTKDAAAARFSNIDLAGDFYNSTGWTFVASSMPGGGGGPGGPGAPGGGAPGGAAPSGGGAPGGGAVLPAGDSPSAGGPGGPPGGGSTPGARNMVLTFDNARIKGVISSTEAHHLKAKLDMTKEFSLFGVVNNTVHETINNGVVVSLAHGSKWTVTGTSYLTKLTLSADASVSAGEGHSVLMTVDGKQTPIEPGKSYTGAIVVALK